MKLVLLGLVLLTQSLMANPKICEFLYLGEPQLSEVEDLVDKDRLILESLKTEYKQNQQLYEKYLQEYPNITIFIGDIAKQLSQSKQEIEEIQINQFLHVFSKILNDKQRSLIPVCSYKIRKLLN